MAKSWLILAKVSQRLVVGQHVWVPLAGVVDGAPVAVAVAELAVARGAAAPATAEPLPVGGHGRPAGGRRLGPRVDYGMVRVGRQQLILALPAQGLLFLKLKYFVMTVHYFLECLISKLQLP